VAFVIAADAQGCPRKPHGPPAVSDLLRQEYVTVPHRHYIASTVKRRALSAVDVVVPLVAAGVITVGIAAHSGGRGATALALGAGAGLSLVGWRRAPALTLALSGALTIVLLHLEPDAGASAVVAPAVALYSLGLRRGARARVIAAAAAVAAIVLVETLHRGGPTLAQTLGHALLVAIPLLIADLHRTRHANLALLNERLELAELNREQEAQRRADEERLRIARELHDIVAHTLTVINVQASTAKEVLERNPAHVRGALGTIEEASRDAIDELRAILGVLRSTKDAAAPLRPAPGIDDVPELIRRTRDDGIDVQLELRGDRPERVPEGVSLAAYRIVQESLTNARRHAAGAAVHVTLAFLDDRVTVAVENASGTAPHINGHGPGVGIIGMRERAAAVGGTLSALPGPLGFRVDADLPYARA
jgi:signal transduction histidine kinase